MRKTPKIGWVYKVARLHNDGTACSVNAGHRRKVQYGVNIVSEPLIGENAALFVFPKLSDAMRFASGRCNVTIFKGIAVGLKSQIKTRYGVMRTEGFPKGTMFCEKFIGHVKLATKPF